MISLENKEFLKKYFKINADNYTEKELDLILDEIIKTLDKNILEKEATNLAIIEEIANGDSGVES